MNNHEFQEILTKITDCLNEDSQEEKTMQLVNLNLFKDCYAPEMKIINSTDSKVNIVELEHKKIGVFFYDLYKAYKFKSALIKAADNKFDLEELWFVFLEGKNPLNTRLYIDFIEKQNLDALFHKTFLLQTPKLAVHQLS